MSTTPHFPLRASCALYYTDPKVHAIQSACKGKPAARFPFDPFRQWRVPHHKNVSPFSSLAGSGELPSPLAPNQAKHERVPVQSAFKECVPATLENPMGVLNGNFFKNSNY